MLQRVTVQLQGILESGTLTCFGVLRCSCSVLYCVVVRYSVLQCVAVYCSLLQSVVVCCSHGVKLTSFDSKISFDGALQNCDILHCSALQDCKILQHTAAHCNTLQYTATLCNTLQRTATHCNTLQHTLQHTATHCNTLQHTATHIQHTLHLHSPRVYRSLLQASFLSVAVCCSVLQCVAVCCSPARSSINFTKTKP